MIPRDYITAWSARAPWRLDAQVEQDLVISRAIVELFSVPELASSLVFRGGTALYKIYLTPPARYSEDIDLVQVRAESIGETLDRARVVLDPWLGEPRRVFKEGRVNLVYRFESEDSPPFKLRLKIEINTRAQFEENLARKRDQPDFRDDVGPLLRPGLSWDFDRAMDAVLDNLVARLPGDPWKGEEQPAGT